MKKQTPEELEELKQEFEPHHRRPISCVGNDFCGAEDCPRCHPETFDREQSEGYVL